MCERSSVLLVLCAVIVFFFNDTATTEIYTLSLHDALPISIRTRARESFTPAAYDAGHARAPGGPGIVRSGRERSEEHTSELQSRQYLVCRLLLEKKKANRHRTTPCTTCQKSLPLSRLHRCN